MQSKDDLGRLLESALTKQSIDTQPKSTDTTPAAPASAAGDKPPDGNALPPGMVEPSTAGSIIGMYILLHTMGLWFSAVRSATTCKSDAFWTKALVTLLFGPAGLFVSCGD